MTESKNRRWLIIRNGAIGDTILLSSLIQTIRHNEPDSRIDVMGIRERVDLLVGEGMADNGYSFEGKGLSSLYIPNTSWEESTIKFLETYDLVLAFFAGDRKSFEQKLRVRADQVIRVFPPLPNAYQKKHITEHYMSIAKDFIPVESTLIPWISLSLEEKQTAQLWLQKNEIPSDSFRLGLHVGAGNIEKQVPLIYFQQCVEYLQERFPVSILLPQGPADHKAVQNFLRIVSDTHIVKEKNLRKLAAILQCCDLFVGNDSGITHMAAAVNTPTMALFRRTDPEIWSPRGMHTKVCQIN